MKTNAIKRFSNNFYTSERSAVVLLMADEKTIHIRNARRDQKTFHANSLICVFFSKSSWAGRSQQRVAISIMKPMRRGKSRGKGALIVSQAITSLDSINYSLWGWLQMNLSKPTSERSRAFEVFFFRLHRPKGEEKDCSRWHGKGLSPKCSNWDEMKWAQSSASRKESRNSFNKSFQSILRCTTFSTKHLTTQKLTREPQRLSSTSDQSCNEKSGRKVSREVKSQVEDNKKKRIVQYFEIIIDSLSVIEVHKKVNFLFC